jgi:hypothetical protein
MGRFDDALAEADGALKQDPVFWRGHFVRSLALARLERLDEAIAECQIALDNLGRSFEPANSQEQEGVRTQWDTLQEWKRTGTKPF